MQIHTETQKSTPIKNKEKKDNQNYRCHDFHTQHRTM